MITLALLALLPVQPLDDARLEARARALEAEIRCLQCQGEPISQSTSDIAAAMRVRVRGLVAEGRSDDAVRAYFVDRYTEEVLLRPRLLPETWLLWASPALLALLGGLALLGLRRRRAVASPDPGPSDPAPDDR